MPIPTIAPLAALAFTILLSAGCERKNKYMSDGGSSSTTEPEKKDVEVVWKDGRPTNDAPRDATEVRNDDPPPAPKKGGPPPDWSKASAQEWKTGETMLLTAEQAKDYIPGTLRISPDRAHVAHGKKLSDGEVMVLDGKELVKLLKIDTKNIVFSPDSKHLIYTGHNNYSGGYPTDYTIVKDRESWLVPFPGTNGDGRNAVGRFTINDDASEVGSLTTYPAVGINKKGHLGNVISAGKKVRYASVSGGQISIDGKELKKFENSAEFQFSDRGESHAFIVSQSGEMFVVFNGEEQRAYQKIDSLSLSPDGKRFAHRADHEGKQYLIIDGKPKAYAGLFKRKVLFSPDSKRWATILDNKVIVDHVADAPIGTSDQYSQPIVATSLTFSPDSGHYAYFANDNTVNPARWVAVLDGKELGRYDALGGAPVFSRDGQSMAYLARTGEKWAVYINGKKHAEVPHDPQGRWVLEFSPDGKSIGYAGSVDLVWHILLDGKLRERPDEIGPEGAPIGFAPDGTFTYLVKRKGAYYRVAEQRQ